MSQFHLLGYSASVNSATEVALAGANDEGWSLRNSNYIFSDKILVHAAWLNGAAIARGRLNVPSINAIGRHQFWPVNIAATIPSPPRICDYRNSPIELPPDEEISVETMNAAGGAEIHTAFLAVSQSGVNRTIPLGKRRLTIRATGAVAGVADAWSLFGALTFAENLRGGWYAVVGCQVFDAGCRAFRLSFVTSPLVNGRRYRPGWLTTEAVGNMQADTWEGAFGEWGRFHSFEPPQIQIWGNATAASVQEIRLDVVYLGDGARP